MYRGSERLDYFYSKAMSTGDEGDWFIAQQMRNIANKMTRSAKAEFVKGELDLTSDDPRKFWRRIKEHVLPDCKTVTLNLVDEYTSESIPDEAMPNRVNDFFTDIGLNLASRIRQYANDSANDLPAKVNTSNFEVHLVTEDQVKDKISRLSVHKSSGIQEVGSRFMKDCMLALIPVFTHLYNIVITTGCFPDTWKVATVIPIQKITNARLRTDLRPISLLPITGKILEQLVHDQMKQFLEDTEFLVKTQQGFRKEHSTTSALSELIDDLLMNLDNSMTTVALYLDFKKAFDTLTHQILLDKLGLAGFGPLTCRLIQNYLSNRKQTVVLIGRRSKERSLTTGVPQGSMLGPLLFLLYINDLPLCLNYSSTLLFADDTVIYLCDDNCDQLQAKLQEDIAFTPCTFNVLFYVRIKYYNNN